MKPKWKGPFLSIKTIKAYQSNNKLIAHRSSTIQPHYVGQTFVIHNGKKYVELIVTESHIGFKFGEFAPTRVKFVFKSKKIKKTKFK